MYTASIGFAKMICLLAINRLAERADFSSVSLSDLDSLTNVSTIFSLCVNQAAFVLRLLSPIK